MQKLASFLGLFTSLSTLLCCALPALLVSLGLGAVMAGLTAHLPGLIWISEHEALVFTLAGFMLAANGALMWTNRNAHCPTDPKLRAACLSGRRISSYIYYFSILAFSTGCFFAFILPQLI